MIEKVKYNFFLRNEKITRIKSEISVINVFKCKLSSSNNEQDKLKTPKNDCKIKKYFNFENQTESDIENKTNFIFKKYNSQEISYNDNPKSQKLSEFEKEFKDIRNNTQNNNEEKQNSQSDSFLFKRNKPKFKLNIRELEKTIIKSIIEIYFRIKSESKNNSETFYKKIDINKKEKNKEEIKEEKNDCFSENIKKPQEKNRNNKKNLNNEQIKNINIINSINDKNETTETTYEDSRNNDNNKNEIKYNVSESKIKSQSEIKRPSEIKKPRFNILINEIRKLEKILKEKENV